MAKVMKISWSVAAATFFCGVVLGLVVLLQEK